MATITWKDEVIELPLNFEKFLESMFGKDWDSEYTGTIYGLLLAWRAGIKSAVG